jgi:hypothetical protein
MTETVSAVAPVDSCTWNTDKLCYLFDLIQDDSQYVTWFLVFVGWAITVVIAYTQYKKSSKNSKSASHNEWVREFREKLEALEDEALLFWTTSNEQNSIDAIVVAKLTRNVKELTTIAKDIKDVGGKEYQSTLFKELRQSITKNAESSSRPLPSTDYRVQTIRRTCSELRRSYRRKSD